MSERTDGGIPLETRLAERAARLDREPLLDPAKSARLRAELREEAMGEGRGIRRRPWGLVAMGFAAAAALLLVLSILQGGDSRDFGAVEVQVALLDDGGRVLSDGDSLRSAAPAAVDDLTSCLVEIVSPQQARIAVRVQIEGNWVDPWNDGPRSLEAGEEHLQSLDLGDSELVLLVIASRDAIPRELLDDALARVGWEGLEAELGCRVQLRRLSRGNRAE